MIPRLITFESLDKDVANSRLGYYYYSLLNNFRVLIFVVSESTNFLH